MQTPHPVKWPLQYHRKGPLPRRQLSEDRSGISQRQPAAQAKNDRNLVETLVLGGKNREELADCLTAEAAPAVDESWVRRIDTVDFNSINYKMAEGSNLMWRILARCTLILIFAMSIGCSDSDNEKAAPALESTNPKWQNWTGNLVHAATRSGEDYYFRPESLSELQEILARRPQQMSIRVSGQRHSQPRLCSRTTVKGLRPRVFGLSTCRATPTWGRTGAKPSTDSMVTRSTIVWHQWR